jgi:hypothetical protein
MQRMPLTYVGAIRHTAGFVRWGPRPKSKLQIPAQRPRPAPGAAAKARAQNFLLLSEWVGSLARCPITYVDRPGGRQGPSGGGRGRRRLWIHLVGALLRTHGVVFGRVWQFVIPSVFQFNFIFVCKNDES